MRAALPFVIYQFHTDLYLVHCLWHEDLNYQIENTLSVEFPNKPDLRQRAHTKSRAISVVSSLIFGLRPADLPAQDRLDMRYLRVLETTTGDECCALDTVLW